MVGFDPIQPETGLLRQMVDSLRPFRKAGKQPQFYGGDEGLAGVEPVGDTGDVTNIYGWLRHNPLFCSTTLILEQITPLSWKRYRFQLNGICSSVVH